MKKTYTDDNDNDTNNNTNNNADTNIEAILDPLWTVIYGNRMHDLCDTGATLYQLS